MGRGLPVDESLEKLLESERLLATVELKPVQGDRFQPTGFPELGAAEYTLPDGTPMVLVESAQSMANRLEACCWDEESTDLIEPLRGMPYVRVIDGQTGQILTNSILEAHRLNSPYILEGEDGRMLRQLQEELDTSAMQPIDARDLARVVLKYDPNSLLHGVFLARKELAGGRFRLRRLLSAFIEAREVRPVESGGAKHDRVNPKGDTNKGFGHVLYPRTEFAAEAITCYFNVDLTTLRAYSLDLRAMKFLAGLAMFKIRRFLATGLRLRSACDLACGEIKVDSPAGWVLPSLEELTAALPGLIADVEGFAEPPVTSVQFNPELSKRKDADSDNRRNEDQGGEDDGEDA